MVNVPQELLTAEELNSYQSQLAPEAFDVLSTVNTRYRSQLTSGLDGYFSEADMAKITLRAAEELKKNLTGPDLAPEDIEDLWEKITDDFRYGGHWGFKKISIGPPRTQKKPSHKGIRFGMIWLFLQGMIVGKIFIYIFGLRYGRTQSRSDLIPLVMVMLIIFLGPLIYVIKNINREDL